MAPRPEATQRPDDQRRAMLGAAIDQIAQFGYDGVRLRDIASAAGVSIGLLQHHFGTREELLGEAFEQHCVDLLTGWEEVVASDLDPWERMVGLLARLTSSPALTQRAITWTDFCASASRRAELRPHLRRVYARWRTILMDAIGQGTERGLFHPVLPVDLLVDLLISEIDGALMALAADTGHMDAARLQAVFTSSAAVLLGYPAD